MVTCTSAIGMILVPPTYVTKQIHKNKTMYRCHHMNLTYSPWLGSPPRRKCSQSTTLRTREVYEDLMKDTWVLLIPPYFFLKQAPSVRLVFCLEVSATSKFSSSIIGSLRSYQQMAERWNLFCVIIFGGVYSLQFDEALSVLLRNNKISVFFILLPVKCGREREGGKRR